MKSAGFILAFLAGGALAQVSVPPASFAARAPIETAGSGPFFQASLPLAVYAGAQRADLGDLRVFNGAGEVVPHAWLAAHTSIVSDVTESPLTVFALRASSSASEGWSLDVTRNADGTLVALRQSAGDAKLQSVGALFDISQRHRQAHQLRLTLAPNAPAFQHFSLDTSDDLQHWRPLLADAQIVHLERDGQRIQNNQVTWDGGDDAAGKYLRVLWREPQSAGEIVSATIGVLYTTTRTAPLLWTTPIVANATQPDSYEYALPGRLPLEQLRIGLQQSNTLAPVIVQRYQPVYGRRSEQGSWVEVTRTIAYRLSAAQGEEQSPPLLLNLPPESRLRLIVDSRAGGLGAAAPTVALGFTPQRLVFLARGGGPFTLAWGAAAVQPSALALASLVPGYDPEQPLVAATARIIPAAATALTTTPALQSAANANKSKGLLWAVLLIGVAILGGMSFMLVKQMRSAPPSAHDE